MHLIPVGRIPRLDLPSGKNSLDISFRRPELQEVPAALRADPIPGVPVAGLLPRRPGHADLPSNASGTEAFSGSAVMADDSGDIH